MNHRDLAEAAAILARHANLIIDRDQPLKHELIEEYWVAARRRWKRWLGQECTSFSEGVTLSEEILVSEMTTRTWTAIYYVHSLNHKNQEGLRLVRQALHWHIDARQFALQRLIDEHHPKELSGLLRLDRLRRRVERWTDFLVGTITRHGVALHLAFDPDRCRNNAQSIQDSPASEAVWPLTIAGLTRSFSTTPLFSIEAKHAHLSVLRPQLAAFPASAFHRDGRPLSAPLNRIVKKLLDRIPHGPNEELS